MSVEVYPGNTGDPSTVPNQIEKLRKHFGLCCVVLVGDRGMLTQTQIDKIKDYPGLGWISALRFRAIRKLVNGGSLQMSLVDEKNLTEIQLNLQNRLHQQKERRRFALPRTVLKHTVSKLFWLSLQLVAVTAVE